MGERIITADEARQLREGADPGPYSYSCDGIIWPTREDAADAVGCVSPRLVPEESHGTGALLAASWDLALTVEHLSALPAARMRAAWLLVADALDDVADGHDVGEAVAYAVDARPGEWPAVAAAIRAMVGPSDDPGADVVRIADVAARWIGTVARLTAERNEARAEVAGAETQAEQRIWASVRAGVLQMADALTASAEMWDAAARTVRALTAERDEARAEVARTVARLSRILAVERGDETRAPAGWARYGDSGWRHLDGTVIQRFHRGDLDTWERRGLLDGDPRRGPWSCALQAMEAIDAERGVSHA